MKKIKINLSDQEKKDEAILERRFGPIEPSRRHRQREAEKELEQRRIRRREMMVDRHGHPH